MKRPDVTLCNVEAVEVRKHYGGVRALDGVSLTAPGGMITAVVGENGAGKSTLMRIIAGTLRPDGGSVSIAGERVAVFDPRTALARYRVSLVPQELDACPGMSVAANVFLGNEPQRRGVVDRQSMEAQARDLLEVLGLGALDPRGDLGRLGLAAQQIVVIARALARRSRVIVLDEPTAAISDAEAARLFAVLRNLATTGSTIVYVSHRIQEVIDLADKIVVLRDGLAVGEQVRECADRELLVRMMIGKDLSVTTHEAGEGSRKEQGKGGSLVLKAKQLAGPGFTSFEIEVYAGEVVGLAGLADSGCSEVIAALYGTAKIRGGQLQMVGREGGFRSPREAIRQGIGLITGDRRARGIFPNLTVGENLAMLDLSRVGHLGFVRRRDLEAAAAESARLASVRAPSLASPVTALSGGNQQKVVVGRALSQQPKLLLADEPTRGVDVRSRRDIHEFVRAMAVAGGAALVSSSDWDELRELCDRVVVMYRGRVVGSVHMSSDEDESAVEHMRALAIHGRRLGAEVDVVARNH